MILFFYDREYVNGIHWISGAAFIFIYSRILPVRQIKTSLKFPRMDSYMSFRLSSQRTFTCVEVCFKTLDLEEPETNMS